VHQSVFPQSYICFEQEGEKLKSDLSGVFTMASLIPRMLLEADPASRNPGEHPGMDILILNDGPDAPAVPPPISEATTVPPGNTPDYDDFVWTQFEIHESRQVEAGVDRVLFQRVVDAERKYRYYDHVLTKHTSMFLLRDFQIADTFLQSIPARQARGLEINQEFYDEYEARDAARLRALGHTAGECQEPPEWLLDGECIDDMFENLGEEEELAKELDKTRLVLLRARYARLSERQKALIHSAASTSCLS
jgi:hypothetical protein